jgi:hypothetical protein
MCAKIGKVEKIMKKGKKDFYKLFSWIISFCIFALDFV